MKNLFKKAIDLTKNNVFGGGHTYRSCLYATDGGQCGDTTSSTYSDTGQLLTSNTEYNNCLQKA